MHNEEAIQSYTRDLSSLLLQFQTETCIMSSQTIINSEHQVRSPSSSINHDAYDFLFERLRELKSLPTRMAMGLRGVEPALGRPRLLTWVFSKRDQAPRVESCHHRSRGELVIDTLVLKDSRNLWPVVVVMILVHLLLKLFQVFIRDHLASAIAAHLVRSRVRSGLRPFPAALGDTFGGQRHWVFVLVGTCN